MSNTAEKILINEYPEAWKGFERGEWNEKPDVRDFIQRNYTPYSGDSDFLSGPRTHLEA